MRSLQSAHWAQHGMSVGQLIVVCQEPSRVCFAVATHSRVGVWPRHPANLLPPCLSAHAGHTLMLESCSVSKLLLLCVDIYTQGLP